MSERRKPIHEIRLGRVRAAIWHNERKGDGKTMFSVTMSKIYIDAEGKWNDSHTFYPSDLLLLCKVADRVHSWCHDSRPLQAMNDIDMG